MAKYPSLDEEIAVLNKLYFDMSETARGYARQGDAEAAHALMDQVGAIRRKLRWARLAKAQPDAPEPANHDSQLG